MLRIFAFLLLILLFSCSDSGTGPGGNKVALGTFRVDIDGTRWDATQGIVFSSIDVTQDLLSVSAVKSISTSQSNAIAISIGAPANNPSDFEGTYALDATETAALSFVTTNSENIISYISFDGEVTINNVSETSVSGVFNATCVNTVDPEDTITLTNGAFNALITNP